MSTRRLLIVASLVVIGVILAPSVALAIDCEPTLAEREDLEFLAEQKEIDVDEAIERHGWHGCFSEIATSLSQRYPDDYAGAAIVDEGRRAWIAFRREVPAEAVELAGEVPVAVEFIGHRGFSEAELDEKLRAVHGQVAAHPDVAASSGSYDVETGRITILAQPVDEVEDGEDRERLLDELRPEPPDNEAVTVELSLIDEIGAPEEDAGLTSVARSPWLWLLTGVLIAAAVVSLVSGRRDSSQDRHLDQLSSTSDGSA